MVYKWLKHDKNHLIKRPLSCLHLSIFKFKSCIHSKRKRWRICKFQSWTKDLMVPLSNPKTVSHHGGQKLDGRKEIQTAAHPLGPVSWHHTKFDAWRMLPAPEPGFPLWSMGIFLSCFSWFAFCLIPHQPDHLCSKLVSSFGSGG